jgi:dTDP-4-amino-4,6-dideoxygalactose transaminase
MYGGRNIGTLGQFGCFSFQQSKQITCGDGGVTIINDPIFAERARLFTDKGWMRRGGRAHRFLGMNYRMTELQGAVALAQFRKLPRLLAWRRAAADSLTRALKKVDGVVLPRESPNHVCSWWKFPIGIDEQVVDCTKSEFCDVLRVEGLRFMSQYLRRPLFDEDMIRLRNTYGTSGYPLSTVNYAQPNVSDYPGYTEFTRRWILLDWSSRVKDAHVAGIANAITKVVEHFRRNGVANAQEIAPAPMHVIESGLRK